MYVCVCACISVSIPQSVLMEHRYGVGLTKKEYLNRCVADDVTFDVEPCPAVTTLPAILANKLNWQVNLDYVHSTSLKSFLNNDAICI